MEDIRDQEQHWENWRPKTQEQGHADWCVLIECISVLDCKLTVTINHGDFTFVKIIFKPDIIS